MSDERINELRRFFRAREIFGPPSGAHWADHEIAVLREMYAGGVELSVIGDVLGRSVHAVSTRARRLGLTDGQRKRVPPKDPPATVLFAPPPPQPRRMRLDDGIKRTREPESVMAKLRKGLARMEIVPPPSDGRPLRLVAPPTEYARGSMWG